MWSAVASPVVVGLVARTTSRDLAALDAPQQLGDLQVVGVDAVDRRKRAAEHVVEAAVLVGALDRDHVGGLLDDADQRLLAVGSEQIRQSGPSARLKQRSQRPTFSFTSRIAVARRLGLLVRRPQDVEGEALRGALADPRQPGQLGDQARRAAPGPRSVTYIPGEPPPMLRR